MGHPLLAVGQPDAPALVDAVTGAVLSYDALGHAVDREAERYAAAAGRVVLLGIRQRPEDVVRYLALWQAGATVLLVDAATPDAVVAGWRAGYRPDAVLGLSGSCEDEADVVTRLRARDPAPVLADRVLLPTSGTTGSPKFVRLSQECLVANAAQIVSALRLAPDHRAMGYLPLHYSYGLSVLHSHLLAGACTVLSRASLTRPEFRRTLEEQRVTSLPGVPFAFEVFARLRLLERPLPDLRDVTQAGGKLALPRLHGVAALLASQGVRFWTMYGQTEATARIAVLPPEELPEAAGSVGYALPGESVTVDADGPGGEGEILLSGPNVMLGYALGRDDLGTGVRREEPWRTGDLGRIDPAGRLWVTGRVRRIAKVYGVRVSLDDLEAAAAPLGVEAVLDDGDRVVAVVPRAAASPGLARRLDTALGLPVGAVRVEVVDEVPRTSSGKLDHAGLADRLVRTAVPLPEACR